MESSHRIAITDNLNRLLAKTDYNKLSDQCVRHKILSPVMIQNLEKFPENERHKELLIKITKRGPTAYDTLLNICKNEFPTAENILCPNRKDMSISENKIQTNICKRDVAADDIDQINYDSYLLGDESPLELKAYSRSTTHDELINVKKSKKCHFHKRVATYSMRTRNRGVFLMVNIINFPNSTSLPRNGAQIDRENLIHLFRELGYVVFYYEDLTLEQFRYILGQIVNSEETKRTESFVMAVMTHGNMNQGVERIEFHDSAQMRLTEILEYFSNFACKNLSGKPKIFLFPFCRGDVSDKGVYGTSESQKYAETDGMSETKSINHPTMSDILILYATVPGYKTHRDPTKGSWYVQKLCEVWAKFAHNTDIESLEKMVGEETGMIREANGAMQTSCKVTYGFYKALYFNPGYYEQ